MNTLAASSSSGSGLATLALSAFVILLLFFFMIVRPQKRNVARHKAMVASLKAGDDIITSGGIYGTITSIEDDDAAMVKISDDVTVKIAIRSIAMKKAVPETEEVERTDSTSKS